jgi:hypothetical protein
LYLLKYKNAKLLFGEKMNQTTTIPRTQNESLNLKFYIESRQLYKKLTAQKRLSYVIDQKKLQGGK